LLNYVIQTIKHIKKHIKKDKTGSFYKFKKLC